MPKRTRNSGGGKAVLAIMLLALLGAGVFAAYVRFTPQAQHVPLDLKRTEPDVTITTEPSKPATKKAPKADVLRVPAVIGSEVKLDKEAGDVPDGVQPAVFLANQTLHSLGIDARALHEDLKDGVALVDFNPALEKGYGTIEEGNLIKALQMAFGQFKEIQKFQIYIEGKPIESLGNIDLTQPLDVIRPGQQPPSDSPSNSDTPANG